MILRSVYTRVMQRLYRQVWPISQEADKTPKNWSGWPEQKKFALVLTHDVENSKGLDRCEHLIKIEEKLGFRSCIFFIAEQYPDSSGLRDYLMRRGFEVGIHGLKHDGKLYASIKEFQRRAVRINRYLKKWGSVGFRSPCMLHNLAWLRGLEIEYDCSTFDTDPFEPQPDGMNTVFPFWVSGDEKSPGYVELPYTLAQDWTVFVLLKEKTIDLWKRKLDWIVKNGGMALLITHPDYMSFDADRLEYDEYPAEYYEEFLSYIKSKYEGQYWHALPKDMARFYASNKTSMSANSR